MSATAFADFADPWLARSHLKPRTFEGNESLLRVHILPAFGGTRLDRIDTMSIEAWITERRATGLSASRVRQAHQVLSQILTAAVKGRYLPSNPAIGVKLPKLKHREQLFLGPEEVEELASVIRVYSRAFPRPFRCLQARLLEGKTGDQPAMDTHLRRVRDEFEAMRKDALYCTPAHKTVAYRQRREDRESAG